MSYPARAEGLVNRIWLEYFSPEKKKEAKQSKFSGWEWLSLLKSFPLVLYGLSRMKNIESLYAEKLRHSHVPGYGHEWFAGTVINCGLNFIKKFGFSYLIWRFRLRLMSCSTFVILIGHIQLFLILYTDLRLIPKHSKIFILELPSEYLAIQHVVSKFLEE